MSKRGETVEVLALVTGEPDDLGNESNSWGLPLTVSNVLVAPTSTTDLSGSIRPDGDSTTLTLYFPKSFTGALRGARVIVRGQTYEVQGEPFAYDPAITPGTRNLVVTVKRVEG